jgi:hypothetical protein
LSIFEELLLPVIGIAVLGLPLLAFLLPILAMRRWQGVWRLLAGLTMVPIAYDILRIVTGLAADPTSHNLFPLELILWSAPGLFALLVLWLIRFGIRRPPPPSLPGSSRQSTT